MNLAGQRKVGMADLHDLLVDLAMLDVRTSLQSGNVVFRTDGKTTTQLEALLERTAAKRLQLETDFFVRTASDWRALVAANPFPVEAERSPSHLLVVFLKRVPDRAELAILRRAITGRELVRADSRQLYVVYPDGVGRSRLTIALIEKNLATRGTGRNWNTVVRLGVLAGVS